MAQVRRPLPEGVTLQKHERGYWRVFCDGAFVGIVYRLLPGQGMYDISTPRLRLYSWSGSSIDLGTVVYGHSRREAVLALVAKREA